MANRIYLSSPHMSKEGYEMQYIQEAFDTNWIAPFGPNVNAFEQEFARKIRAKHAVALTSGTAAYPLNGGYELTPKEQQHSNHLE